MAELNESDFRQQSYLRQRALEVVVKNRKENGPGSVDLAECMPEAEAVYQYFLTGIDLSKYESTADGMRVKKQS